MLSKHPDGELIIRPKFRTYAKLSNMESGKMLIREIILKVNLFWDLCMQTIENIPKNPEHVDNVPKLAALAQWILSLNFCHGS